MSRRAGIATAVLLAWMVGLALLGRRELFRSDDSRLIEAALRVSPGAEYYQVMQGERHVGFASSTLDTLEHGLQLTDYFVADVTADGAVHRASARTTVGLTRSLRLRSFRVDLGASIGPLVVEGTAEGDTALVIVTTAGERPDTQRVSLAEPVLFPTVVPIVLALGERPRVGRSYRYPIFDPLTMAPGVMTVHVRAETTFVVADSAEMMGGVWRPALMDTVRAWRVEQEGGGPVSGWMDDRGRMVEASQFNAFTLRRTAYEIAYRNWMIARASGAPAVTEDDDILETTAIAANVPIRELRRVERLRLSLAGAPLEGYALSGERQTLRGDTLEVVREPRSRLRASYTLPSRDPRHAEWLAAEPLIQSDHPRIRGQARQIVSEVGDDPRAVAERINSFVFERLEKRVTLAAPNALQVLRVGRGDCNEHTALYVALARAAGLPARSVAGLAYARGRFYYHAWPEVWLDGWVPVDPTFGQFPADAGHLRFVIGGYARQADLLRLVGHLRVDVLSSEFAAQ